jgi:hypothetical protein
VGGQRHAPAALPPGKTQYPLYRRLDGPQGRSGRVRKISPQPEFDPRTFQPVASELSYPGPIILSRECWCYYIFQKLKDFSKIGCVSENRALFLWLQYSAFLVCVLTGERGYCRNIICLMVSLC